MDPRTAVILDRHPLWLDAVEDVLRRLCIEVQGKTTEPDEAVELVAEHRPDVLLLEPLTGGEPPAGATLIRQALDEKHDLKVIVLSSSRDATDVDAAFEAGASIYVFKTARPEDVASAVRQVFEASMIFAPPSAATIHPAEPIGRLPLDDRSPALTRRESEILKLVSDGHSNGELARMLWVTEQTVKFHLSNIYRKIGVANRTEASRWAQLHGLLSETPAAPVAI
jgi:DNA-binding NarL/FixJ family response regulator